MDGWRRRVASAHEVARASAPSPRRSNPSRFFLSRDTTSLSISRPRPFCPAFRVVAHAGDTHAVVHRPHGGAKCDCALPSHHHPPRPVSLASATRAPPGPLRRIGPPIGDLDLTARDPVLRFPRRESCGGRSERESKKLSLPTASSPRARFLFRKSQAEQPWPHPTAVTAAVHGTRGPEDAPRPSASAAARARRGRGAIADAAPSPPPPPPSPLSRRRLHSSRRPPSLARPAPRPGPLAATHAAPSGRPAAPQASARASSSTARSLLTSRRRSKRPTGRRRLCFRPHRRSCCLRRRRRRRLR